MISRHYIVCSYALSIMKQQLYQSNLQLYTHYYVNVTDEYSSGSREALKGKDTLLPPLIKHLPPGTLTVRHTLQCTDGVRVGAGGRSS